MLDVVGKTGGIAPEQIGATSLNVGFIVATFIVIDVVVAQSPGVGVKVYVPDVVLLTVAGFQVPVIPLLEVEGKFGAVEL